MSVLVFVVLSCDHERPGLGPCGEESAPGWNLTEARKIARQAGWKVGRTKQHPDYCPSHTP